VTFDTPDRLVPADPTEKWTVVALSGEIDLSVAPSLRRRIFEAIDRPPARVALDLAHLQFIDSTGLGVLVGALRHARTADGELRLAEPTPAVARVLSVTGLDRVFSVFPTMDEAVADWR
jgi:anti-sigma B factor antagonist